MKYEMITHPYERLKEGDQSISRDNLMNEEKPVWQKVSSVGITVENFPRYVFRRPLADPVTVTLNDAYEALIYPDHVRVGCSRFNHSVILEVAEKIKGLSKVDKL